METVIENLLSFSSSVQYTVAIVLWFLCEKEKFKAMHHIFILFEQTNIQRDD